MAITIVDAHHHIWRLAATPWLQVERTIDLFGPSRCLFGSNFPIESLWTSYGELVDVFRGCLSRFDAGEQRAVLHDTAVHLYRLGTPTT